VNTPRRDTVTRTAIAGILRQSLSDPETLAKHDTAIVAAGINPAAGTEPIVALSLGALSGLAYTRPDLVGAEIVNALGGLYRAPPAALISRLNDALVHVLFTDAAPRAVALAESMLIDADIPPASLDGLATFMKEAVDWRPDLIDLSTLLGIAGAIHLDRQRAALLGQVVERLAFLRPDDFDAAAIGRLAETFPNEPRLKYTLKFLQALRQDDQTGGDADAEFPALARARAVLCDRPLGMLMVINSIFGQGDEVVRAVAFLQSIMDANTLATVTILTKRPYLYDHPRIQPVSLFDADVVTDVLCNSYDAVVSFSQPDQPELNWCPSLLEDINTLIDNTSLCFLLTGDHRDNSFLFQSVVIDGEDVADALGLTKQHLGNIYDPTLRLMAECGLPLRFGEAKSATPSVLIGRPSPEATKVWLAVVKDNVTGRPVALFNPFGGGMPEKGFCADHRSVLQAELNGLIKEGFFVVLLPNGTPWGDRGQSEGVIATLPTELLSFVSIAPDPAEQTDGRMLQLEERPDLPYADRVMRLIKYFTALADLIVTVEGWLGHFAYHLGQPFRVTLMHHACAHAWYPFGRGKRQRIVTELSALCAVDRSRLDVLKSDRPGPFPHYPRRGMLRTCLQTLGEHDCEEAHSQFALAAESQDFMVRKWAFEAFGRAPLQNKKILIGALKDRESVVRSAAAQSLINGDIDCEHELGPKYQSLLQAHISIAHGEWPAVLALGAPALPALAMAVEDRSSHVRHYVREVVARIVGHAVRRGN
jgi:hypothetical protein